jgi:hypothetical protein
MLVHPAPQASLAVNGKAETPAPADQGRQNSKRSWSDWRPTVPSCFQSRGLNIRRAHAGDAAWSALNDVCQALAVQVDAQALQREVVDLAAHRFQAFLADE